MSAITKTRIGFSTAIIVILAMIWNEVLKHARMAPTSEAIFCGTIACLGLAVWVYAGLRGRGQPLVQPVVEPGSDTRESEENPLAFLWKATYWGAMSVVFGGLLYLMCIVIQRKLPPQEVPLPRKRPVVEVQVPVETNVIIETKPAVVTFPPLKVDGFVLSGDKSTAVINGVTLSIGDQIGDVRLVAVELRGVVVELGGQTNVLPLPK